MCVFTHHHFVEDWAVILNFLISFWRQGGKNRKTSNMLKFTLLYSQLYSMLYITNHKTKP